MKISRNYIGKVVCIVWEDPTGGGERLHIEKAKKGRAALARWHEYGRIDDITEGVVRFRQSEATTAGEAEPDEAIFGWVPEELIKECIPLIMETGEASGAA